MLSSANGSGSILSLLPENPCHNSYPHIAATGLSEGIDNFERMLPMFAKHPNLYTEISSLAQVNKLNY